MSEVTVRQSHASVEQSDEKLRELARALIMTVIGTAQVELLSWKSEKDISGDGAQPFLVCILRMVACTSGSIAMLSSTDENEAQIALIY